MTEAINQGIETILLWVKTVWKSLPEEIKPVIPAGAAIGAALLIGKAIFKRK